MLPAVNELANADPITLPLSLQSPQHDVPNKQPDEDLGEGSAAPGRSQPRAGVDSRPCTRVQGRGRYAFCRASSPETALRS